MLLTSGQKQRPALAQQVYRFMLDQEPLLGAATVTVHHRRLIASEGVVGWQQQEDAHDFLIDIERELPHLEYVTTLIHELIHCRQSLEGNHDSDAREEEAYRLEQVYADRYVAACAKSEEHTSELQSH